MMYDLCPYFTNDGTVGLFSRTDDDIYHSTYGALTESWQKFIIPAHFEEYLATHDEVKVLDICYGIGYNTKTALNVFIQNDSNLKKKKSTVFEYLNTIFAHPVSIDIVAIDTDKIQSSENNSETEKINNLYENIQTHADSNIAAIDADNISSSETLTLEKEFELYNHQDNSMDSKIDLIENNACNKILIDAVDVDKVLINLSPFIKRGLKNNLSFKKYFFDDNKKNKLIQIQKMQKTKINLPPKKFRLKKEVSMILLEKLFEGNSEIYNDVILQTILNHKNYTPFLSKFMLNFAKFHSNQGCNSNKKLNKSTFLHNIYYRYITRSYKNVRDLLKAKEIDLNFHKKDARQFILATNNKYNFIFLDAFTPTKCPALWTAEFFRELYSKLDDDGMILTYSSSAAVRNALLQNGFAVGKTYDPEAKKFIGTIAVKNKNLIEHELDELDLDLINSRAGICFKDENLDLDNNTIIKNREDEISKSELISSSQVLKGYKNDKAKSL